MNEHLRDKILGWLTGGILLLIVIGGLVMIFPDYRRSEALKRQNDDLREMIENKKREIAELKENQQRFKRDPDFIEMIARQHRRVFPGELVFTFDKQ